MSTASWLSCVQTEFPLRCLYCISRANGFNLKSANQIIRVIKFQLECPWPELPLSCWFKALQGKQSAFGKTLTAFIFVYPQSTFYQWFLSASVLRSQTCSILHFEAQLSISVFLQSFVLPLEILADRILCWLLIQRALQKQLSVCWCSWGWSSFNSELSREMLTFPHAATSPTEFKTQKYKRWASFHPLSSLLIC